MIFFTAEQLTRTDIAKTIEGVSHDLPSIIRPVNLAEFPTQSSRAESLPVLVTFSTSEFLHAFYPLCSSTFSQVAPLTPPPINDLLADTELPLPVVRYHPVGQSLAPVGLLDSADTELRFSVY